MKNRTQVSLYWEDDKIFKDFVLPYKENRLLNTLLVKCATAYFTDETVRNLIEGTSLSDTTSEDEMQSTQSIVDNIRKNIVMQDYLATELQSTNSDNTDDILNKVNEVARQTGMAKPSQTESDSSVLKEVPKTVSSSSQETVSKTQLEIIVQSIVLLAKSQNNSDVLKSLKTSGVVIPDDIIESISHQEKLGAFDEVLKSVSNEAAPLILAILDREKKAKEASDVAKRTILDLQEQLNIAESKEIEFESVKDTFVKAMNQLQEVNTRLELKNQQLQEELNEYNAAQHSRKSYGAFDDAIIVSNNHIKSVQDSLQNAVEYIQRILDNSF